MQQKQYELFEILRDAYLYEPKINFSANVFQQYFLIYNMENSISMAGKYY